MVLDRNSDLFQIILTLRASRRFAGGLDSRQQEGDQDPDDRDHNQKFDEREARACNANTHGKLLSMKKGSCPPGGVGLRRTWGGINYQHIRAKDRDGSTTNRSKIDHVGHFSATSCNIPSKMRSQIWKYATARDFAVCLNASRHQGCWLLIRCSNAATSLRSKVAIRK
jgi:hypothetical protein